MVSESELRDRLEYAAEQLNYSITHDKWKFWASPSPHLENGYGDAVEEITPDRTPDSITRTGDEEYYVGGRDGGRFIVKNGSIEFYE